MDVEGGGRISAETIKRLAMGRMTVVRFSTVEEILYHVWNCSGAHPASCLNDTGRYISVGKEAGA
jgi:hypothetical protein